MAYKVAMTEDQMQEALALVDLHGGVAQAARAIGVPRETMSYRVQRARAHAAQTEFLDVDDPGILADIDDAEAYARLTGATR